MATNSSYFMDTSEDFNSDLTEEVIEMPIYPPDDYEDLKKMVGMPRLRKLIQAEILQAQADTLRLNIHLPSDGRRRRWPGYYLSDDNEKLMLVSASEELGEEHENQQSAENCLEEIPPSLPVEAVTIAPSTHQSTCESQSNLVQRTPAKKYHMHPYKTGCQQHQEKIYLCVEKPSISEEWKDKVTAALAFVPSDSTLDSCAREASYMAMNHTPQLFQGVVHSLASEEEEVGARTVSVTTGSWMVDIEKAQESCALFRYDLVLSHSLFKHLYSQLGW